MGKGEIARHEQFLLYPQCFLLNQIIVSPCVHIFDIISLFAAELEEPKIGKSGKGLSIEWASGVTLQKLYLLLIRILVSAVKQKVRRRENVPCKISPFPLTLSQTSPGFYVSAVKAF